MQKKVMFNMITFCFLQNKVLHLISFIPITLTDAFTKSTFIALKLYIELNVAVVAQSAEDK